MVRQQTGTIKEFLSRISKNQVIQAAMLRGNRRFQVGKERYTIFPSHPSEANNPQSVPRTKLGQE